MDFVRAAGIPIAKSGSFPEDRDIWGRFSDNSKSNAIGGVGRGIGIGGGKEKRQEAKNETESGGHPVL